MSREDDEKFQRIVTEGLVPKVGNSHVCVSIVPNEENFVDAKFCLELGVMVMLDKPILAVVDPNVKVPAKLEAVADEIVRVDINTQEGRDALQRHVIAFGEKFQ